MATYKLLKDLILGETNAPIKVRISRELEGRRAGSTHVTNKTYILLDEEGTQIQATPMPYTLIPDFTKRLKVGHIYMISTYNVVRAAKTYKLVPGEYAINFHRKTTDEKLDDIPAIPMYRFQITSFQQAGGRIDDVTNLMDVVGNLQEVTEIQTSKGGRKYIDIVLADEKNDKIRISLWENQAYAFLELEHEYKKPNVFLIVTGTSSKTMQGKTILWSSTSTQYFFNIDHPAIEALRQNSDMKENLTPTIVPFVKSKTQNTAENIERITIAELHDAKLPPGASATKFITETTVFGIIPHNGWYYMACNKCNRKLNELQECSMHNSTIPVPKYRVTAQVNDSTSDTTFVLFDRHVMKLINVSAQHILYNDKNASPETIPAILNNILGRRYRFNFSLTSYNIDRNKEDYTVNDVEEIKDQEPITAISETINKNDQLDEDNGKDLKDTEDHKRKLSEEENNVPNDSHEIVAALDATNKATINSEHDTPTTSDATNKAGKHNRNKRQK